MDSEIERTIFHYFPERKLESPLKNRAVTWDYDPRYTALKAVLSQLKAVDSSLRPGTRGHYDLSEEVVFRGGAVRLQLSYLGPFAALNHLHDVELSEDDRELQSRIRQVLQRNRITVLDAATLTERVGWIPSALKGRAATVWNCLFVLGPN